MYYEFAFCISSLALDCTNTRSRTSYTLTTMMQILQEVSPESEILSTVHVHDQQYMIIYIIIYHSSYYVSVFYPQT